MGPSQSSNIPVDTNVCILGGNCSSSLNITNEECLAPQMDSVTQIVNASWSGACSCVSVDTSTQSPTGIAVLYAYLPTEKNFCETQESTAQIVAVSIVLILTYLLAIFALIWMAISWRKRLKHYAPTIANKLDVGVDSIPLDNLPLPEMRTPPACYLSFENLYYSVTLNAESQKLLIKNKYNGVKPIEKGWDQKFLLSGLTGCFAPNTLSAIMGPSGCGKSTLLDILADRKSDGNLFGDIRINGEPRNRYFKRMSAYVMQSDALFPNLTVFEYLFYVAELRLESDDIRVKTAAVDRVIRDLDITRVRNSKIGGADVRGISGGQARRVTVAAELLTRPSLLFLDEPTTGLDAYSSLQLVKTLRQLADDGRTVICTIHQPRPDIFTLFNSLLLMKSGEMAYFGPVTEITPYFATLGIIIPPDVSVADFVVDLTYSKDTTSEAGIVVDGVAMLVDNYSQSDAAIKAHVLVEALRNHTLEPKPADILSFFENDENVPLLVSEGSSKEQQQQQQQLSLVKNFNSRFSQPLHKQIGILLRRSYLNMGRSRSYWMAVALQSSQFLFYGLLFLGLRLGPYTYEVLQDLDPSDFFPGYELFFQKRNFLFQVMNTMCIVESVVIASAFLEKRVFLREHASGAYSVLAYHSQWIIQLTVNAIWKALLASILCYFFPPMQITGENFFFFVAVLAVISSVGSSLAFLMVSAIPDPAGASNVHNTIIGFMGTYAGFFLLSRYIPYATVWCYYISFLAFGLEALEWNEFGECGSQYEMELVLSVNVRLNRWLNLLILMAYPVIFHLFALLASFTRTRPRSWWVANCPCCFSKNAASEIPSKRQQQTTNTETQNLASGMKTIKEEDIEENVSKQLGQLD